MPCDRRHDRIDPVVDGGGHQLDTAAVRYADHADARIESFRVVKLDLRLRGQPADDRRHIAGLEVRRVELHHATGTPFPARVPRDDVVAGRTQRSDTHLTDSVGDDVIQQCAVEVGGAGQAQAGPVEDRRGCLARRQSERRHEMGIDLSAVKRDHFHVSRQRGAWRRPGCTG